jgi:hypothetical protein
MEVKQIGGWIAALGIAAAACASTPAFAEKHDSNTLHKIGNAIQYPVRKAGENLSTDVHRGQSHDSVQSDRPHDRKVLVTSQGNKYVMHSDRPVYAHRRAYNRFYYKHHRHHRRYRRM